MAEQITGVTTAEKIKQLEKAETIAFVNEDYAKLDKIWHSQFKVNTPINRILTSSDIRDAMKSGLIRYSLLQRNIEELLVQENIVISFGNEVTIPIGNAPMAGQRVTRRYTNIWTKENDEWKMFARHASNVVENNNEK